MDGDQLARIRAAIEADVDLDKQMTAPPWVSIDGNVETPDGSVAWATHDDIAESVWSWPRPATMDPWDAAGIARARNRWGLYLRLARAAARCEEAFGQTLAWESDRACGEAMYGLSEALAALAEGEASDGQ